MEAWNVGVQLNPPAADVLQCTDVKPGMDLNLNLISSDMPYAEVEAKHQKLTTHAMTAGKRGTRSLELGGLNKYHRHF